MSKTLVALAVLGAFTTAVNAQSSTASGVTLYGIVDSGVRYTTPTGNNPVKNSTWEVASGIQSGSRFGLRGSEDLGGGLRAIFNLEGGVDIDTGRSSQAGRLFGRWAYAGLAGNWGEVRLGRQYAAGFEYFLSIDPFGTAFGDAGMSRTFSSVSGLRFDNTLMYRLPTVSGFTGMVGYSTEVNGAEKPKLDNNAHAWTAGLQYGAGPFKGAFTYENIKNSNCYANGIEYVAPPAANAGALITPPPAVRNQVVGVDGRFNCVANASNGQNQIHYQLGATYDFKVVKLHGGMAIERHQYAFARVTPSDKSQSYAVGFTAPLATGSLLGLFQKRQDKSDLRANLRVIGLGYTYPLSRRTNLYTYFSDSKTQNDTVTDAAFQDLSRRQYAVGLRHTF